MSDKINTKGTQVQGKPKKTKSGPCPWLCNLVPTNVPGPGAAQTVLHPRKDVFVLKVGSSKRAGNPPDGKCSLPLMDICNQQIRSKSYPKLTTEALLSQRTKLKRLGKVAKVGPNGDRRCKMELELVTPKGPERKAPTRIDTRETQCEPDPPPCCCTKTKKKRK